MTIDKMFAEAIGAVDRYDSARSRLKYEEGRVDGARQHLERMEEQYRIAEIEFKSAQTAAIEACVALAALPR